MIIDADTHISPGGGDFALDRHLAAMERSRVDKALVWLSPHHYVGEQIAEHNRYVHEAAKAHPDKLLPFGWADPMVSLDHARKMVKVCSEEYGFLGIKMNGAQNGYFIDDPKVGLPVAEAIAHSGKMIAFHIGPDAYERTHPWRAMRIARLFPETTVLMIHMGMTDRNMNRAVIEAAKECPNMVLIASATTDNATLAAIRELGAERVCFGSDRPFRKMHVIRAMFEESFTDELSSQEMAAFMGGNMARLCGVAG